MSDTPPKPDWRDGLVAAGGLMVLLCGLCSGWTASMDDPYISSAALLVGGLPIGVGITLIVLGLTRPKHAGAVKYERQNIGRRLDAALRMAMGATILLFSSLGAVGLAVALIAPTAEAAGATRNAGEAVVMMIMMLAVFSIPAIVCGLAFLGGLALFRAGQDLAR